MKKLTYSSIIICKRNLKGRIILGKISQIRGMEIKSSYFSNQHTFSLFQENKDRLSIVLGRNGSGKSTIARGFDNLKTGKHTDIAVNLLDEENNVITLEDDSKNIFVFNEQYIENKIKVQEYGVNSIVLLGDQVKIDTEIEQLSKEKEELKKIVEEYQKQLEDFKDYKNPISSLYYFENIKNILRKTWAVNDSKIKKTKQNSSVNDQLVESISKIELSEDPQIDTLKNKFAENLKIYLQMDEESQLINYPVPRLDNCNNIQTNQEKLKFELTRIFSKPMLSEKEKRILEVFNNDYVKLNKASGYLNDTEHTICDNCLQTIHEDYRSEIQKKLQHILNSELEDFVSNLQSYYILEIDSESYSKYEIIDLELYRKILDYTQQINIKIKKHNEAIDKKIKFPYDKVFLPSETLTLYNNQKELQNCLNELEEKRINYNNAVSQKNLFKKELINLNNYLAKISIENDLQEYNAKLRIEKDIEQKYQLSTISLTNKINDIDKLKSKLKQIDIAKNDINRSLKYIFFSNNRLLLKESKDSKYHIKVNGEEVAPSRLSVGERNAIALSYFFTEISEGLKKEDKYSREAFLVIDDPISSFDYSNRIGMMSLLKSQLESFLIGNPNTKVLLLTHDAGIMYDIRKVFDEISSYCKKEGKHANYKVFELENKTFQICPKTFNEYTNLLGSLYDYATSGEPRKEELTIGNNTRRVLEAFSTFSYKVGITELSTDTKILEIIEDEKKRDYFKPLMYRLFLNGESHFEENLQSTPENYFFSSLSKEEKLETVKASLCLMYCLNPAHVILHLKQKRNVEQTFEQWVKAI